MAERESKLPGLVKSALKDPVVRLAALGGALAGALLVLAVVVMIGGHDTPAPTSRPAPVAPPAMPAPAPVAAAPAAPAEAPAPDAYPVLPVTREAVTPPEGASGKPQDKAMAAEMSAEMSAALNAAQGEQATTTMEAPPGRGPHELPAVQDGPPRIAIVIDDMGVDQKRSARAMTLPAPVTLSFLPYARDLHKQAAEARKLGHEIMMHVPMEPESAEVDPGPNVLLSEVPLPDLRKALLWNLSQMEQFEGINNHMGSRFTQDRPGMRLVMEELKARGLFFLDSVTSRATVGAQVAAEVGVPFARRHVFIDHRDDVAFVQHQLHLLEKLARKHGYAIAIGHPRDITLTALKVWIPKVQADGFKLVGVSSLVHPAPAPKPAAALPKTAG